MATTVQCIRDIVATQPSAAAVLQQFEINLCKQGDISLEDACAELQLSMEQVLDKLESARAAATGSKLVDASAMSLARLIQHIVRAHHQFLRQELPRLEQLAAKIAAKHADQLPNMPRISELISNLRNDMFSHLEKEENILFPYIAQLDEDPLLACIPPQSCFQSVTQPVFMMVQEHELAEDIVDQIATLSHGFTAPEWGCTNMLAFFGSLRELQADLRRHVHLENEILFPKAIELERRLNTRN